MAEFFRRSVVLGLMLAVLGFSTGLQNSMAAPRDPARFEKQIAAFEQADQEHPPAPGQVLFLGSSSIVRWNLPESFPMVDALNRGFGGSVIADSIHFFPRIVLPYQPRQVVFYAGDNDLAGGDSPEEVHENFGKLVGMLHKQLPGTPMLFISIKPCVKRWSGIEKVRQANALIKATCDKDPLLTYLDVEPAMLDQQGQPRPELLAADGLHLSPEGYAVWNKLLAPHLIRDQRSARLVSLYDQDHPWTPPETLEEWKEVSQRIREQVLVACGLWPLPVKEELQPVVHGLVDRGDYTIERVSFASLPGHYVTGSLYRPKKVNGKIPAVLCPHGHWADGRFTDAGEKPAAQQLEIGAEQFMSGARFPLQARMVELARLGCVVFHYDMIGVADNAPLEHRGGFADADAALWLHHKLGLQTWNSIRALDFVTSLPDVDARRIGVTGASGGGTQTFLLAAVDPRITVAFPAVMVSTAMQGGCICENADYLRTGISNIAIAALTAPRPLAMSGAHDWTIDLETKGYPELKKVYSLYGKEDLVLAKVFPQFQHNYNQVAREMMYDWFNTHLKLEQPSPVRQTDFWPLTTAEMTVYDAQHPRPDDALKEPELRERLRARDQKAFQDLLAGDPDRFREVIAGARRVLFPASSKTIQVESPRSPLPGEEPQRQFVVTCERARVPVTLLSPPEKTASGRVVLWLDGAGQSHLFQKNGEVASAVRKLLDSGLAVASADLFLTGESGQNDLYSSRFASPSPAHKSTTADKEYTGFIYGYNRTPLAERVRDLEAVVQALQSQKFQQVTVVGTGDAGVWALLAAPDLPRDGVDQVIVDLQSFTFAGIQQNSDPNMVPGARKYGGLGGLTALAFPVRLKLFGASQDHADELQPLSRAYESQPDLLQISPDPLTPDSVLSLLLP